MYIPKSILIPLMIVALWEASRYEDEKYATGCMNRFTLIMTIIVLLIFMGIEKLLGIDGF